MSRAGINRRRKYINILVSGAPGCGVTRLVESFISDYNERDVLMHREYNSDTTACQFPFYMDNHKYIIRTCDLSENTIALPPNRDVVQLRYDIDVVIYLYSVDDYSSLVHLVSLLDSRVDTENLPSVLVGTKVDLRNRQEVVDRSREDILRFVSHYQAVVFAEEFNISWLVECSAETGQSIREVLVAVVNSFLGKKGKRKRI